MTSNRRQGYVKTVKESKGDFLILAPPIRLNNKGLQILKLLGEGKPACKVASIVGCTRANVSYYTKNFLKIGALRLEVRDVIRTYRLTDYGSKIVARGEGLIPEVIALEDYPVKYEVVDWGSCKRLDWKKLGKPRNWTQLGVYIGNVRVVRTSKSIIIHPGKLTGCNLDELLFFSGQIVEKVVNVLETRFGMSLNMVGTYLHKPNWRFYSEEAKELVKMGNTTVQGVGSIDNSPPERVPHEEYVGNHLGYARLLMPLKVARLEKHFSGLEHQVEIIDRQIGEIKDSMNEIKLLLRNQQVLAGFDMNRKV